MLLRIDAYRKYEPLRMLNLLTVLSVRLLARVPTVLTVLAVPVLELELVFERTLSRNGIRVLQYPDLHEPSDLVWAKMRGHPHWPARVRYTPHSFNCISYVTFVVGRQEAKQQVRSIFLRQSPRVRKRWLTCVSI